MSRELYAAVVLGNKDKVTSLLDAGADPNWMSQKSREDKETSLYLAVQNNRIDLVEILLSCSRINVLLGEVFVSCEDYVENTCTSPLELAIRNKRWIIVKKILDHYDRVIDHADVVNDRQYSSAIEDINKVFNINSRRQEALGLCKQAFAVSIKLYKKNNAQRKENSFKTSFCLFGHQFNIGVVRFTLFCYSIFLGGFSSTEKKNALNHYMKIVNTQTNDSLSDKERRVIGNGRLGEIIKRYEIFNNCKPFLSGLGAEVSSFDQKTFSQSSA